MLGGAGQESKASQGTSAKRQRELPRGRGRGRGARKPSRQPHTSLHHVLVSSCKGLWRRKHAASHESARYGTSVEPEFGKRRLTTKPKFIPFSVVAISAAVRGRERKPTSRGMCAR